jgi:hypothetical protein
VKGLVSNFFGLAYASYSLVWQEYKRMGQIYHEFIDRDTISGIQFG